MSSSGPTFALITPTFAGDYKQFTLLARTAEYYLSEDVPHYVIVPGADYSKFKALQSKRTHLLIEEEVLPQWTQGLFKFKNKYRVTTRTLPIRGWILQQLVKIAAPSFASGDVFLYADSDVAFLRGFDPAKEFVRDGKVKLFREICDESWPQVLLDRGRNWRNVSCRLLGIAGDQEPRAGFSGYVGNVIPWRRDVLESLQKHLDRGWGRSWPERIARCKTFSEYTLYGVYVEKVLGMDVAGHYPDETICALESWQAREQSVADLTRLREEKLASHHIALMVSAKGGTPAERIEQVFGLH